MKKNKRNIDLLFNRFGPFCGASEDVIQFIQNNGQFVNINSKQFVFNTGDKLNGFYGLLDGEIELSRSLLRGKKQIYWKYDSGEWLGSHTYYSSMPSPHDAYALSKSKLLYLNTSVLEQIYRSFPALYKITLKQISISQVLHVYHQYQTNNFPLLDRLAQLILIFVKTKNSTEIKITQSDIACMLGVSREALCLQLKRLQNDKSIEIGYKKILITDMNKLLSYVRDEYNWIDTENVFHSSL